MARLFYFTVVVLLLALAALPSSQAQQHCPQSDVRPESWVQEVVNAMQNLPTSAERVSYLNRSVGNDTRVFSGVQLVEILSVLSFVEDKVNAIKITSPYVVGLNTTEFVSVLSAISFSPYRLTVLSVLKDTLLNATSENKAFIAETCWSMSADQQQAYAILRDVASRDCIFGSVTARSATFVIDVSGSMKTPFSLNGTQYTRLSYVQEHLSQVIATQLQPYQQFNVIVFSDNPGALFRAPVNATADNIKSALSFVAGLRFGGGTNTYSALQLAFASSPNTLAVYLLSDGLPNSGQIPYILKAIPAWEAQRAADRQIRIYSTAFLLGPDSASNKQQSAEFMKQVATLTNGIYRNMDMA